MNDGTQSPHNPGYVDPHATAIYECLRCGQTFEDLAVQPDIAWCPYCDRSVAVVRRH